MLSHQNCRVRIVEEIASNAFDFLQSRVNDFDMLRPLH
jgi:hypothetical protein